MRFSRILLVNPPNVEQGGYTPSPLGLLYLAAYVRNLCKAHISIVDGSRLGEQAVMDALTTFDPDLVGVSSLTPGRHEAIKVTKLVKKINPRCKIILGGIHPTIMWQQMMNEYPQIDYIARGEGEATLLDIVTGKRFEDIRGLVWRKRKNTIINNDYRLPIPNLNDLPFPAWDLIDPTIYPARGERVVNGIDLETETRYPIIFSRGCMACCTFCSSWKVWKGYRFRNGKNVVDEMEFLTKKYGAKHFVFYDDTLTGSKKEIIHFCKEIIRRKLHVALYGTTRVDKIDQEILIWMKRAGFYEISYGIESGSPDMLIKINKRTNLDLIIHAAKLTRKAGIRVCALMMYGLPRETPRDRFLTERLLKKMKPESIGSIGEVWIFPGTALYEQAKNSNLLDDRFWLSKKPYYIYRGGIGGDTINWRLRAKDEWLFAIRGTLIQTPSELFFIKAQHLFKKINFLFKTHLYKNALKRLHNLFDDG